MSSLNNNSTTEEINLLQQLNDLFEYNDNDNETSSTCSISNECFI